ncbi:MAG: hypothetical protein Q9M30_04430 [Mariprofundaceae bacterium]|nr:hypothetical protein [Mariprofundaceae bacterium]
MRISRRINQTGRKKIPRSDVTINVREQQGKLVFTAAFNLNATLPPDGALYVEAYNSNTLQRFDFGTVGFPRDPASTLLDQLDLSSPVKFRVKVVDESGHSARLIASAEGLRSEEDAEEERKASLMTFKSAPLGSLTWKVVCSDDEDGMPVLYLNNMIPAAKDTLLLNPVFRGLVLPGALREVLFSILTNLDDGGEPAEGSWQERWLGFASGICPPDTGAGMNHDWVNGVAEIFSDKFSLCEKLVQHTGCEL